MPAWGATNDENARAAADSSPRAGRAGEGGLLPDRLKPRLRRGGRYIRRTGGLTRASSRLPPQPTPLASRRLMPHPFVRQANLVLLSAGPTTCYYEPGAPPI